MGTRAIFAIASDKNRHFTTVLGLGHDGYSENLLYLEQQFWKFAKELRLLTKVRQYDYPAILQVLTAMEKEHGGWWFITDLSRVSGIHYSSILDPKTKNMKLFEGRFEYPWKDSNECYS